jgi:hypothetical protein
MQRNAPAAVKKKRPAAGKKEGEGGGTADSSEAQVQLISTENGLSDDERDNEGMEGYHAGGYHPVAIGDKFKQRQYTVRARVLACGCRSSRRCRAAAFHGWWFVVYFVCVRVCVCV